MDDAVEVKSLLKGIAELLPTLATKADLATLATKADLAEVKCDIEALQHTVAANHFRTGGRIDPVASMLAEHMADPEGPHHPLQPKAASGGQS